MKKLILKFINKLGYSLEKNSSSKQSINGYSYLPVKPDASFAPWVSDSEFNYIYEIIKPNTLVDLYRCYELWQLVGQTEKNSESGDYLEVGSWQGGTSGIIASRLKLLHSTANLFIADTFEGVVKTTGKDNYYQGGEHADTSEIIVLNLLKEKLHLKNFSILKGMFPDQTAHLIPSGQRFKFCHIDVDVYQGAKEITEWIWPNLIVGGIIVYDDYGFVTTSGVTSYVEEIRDKKGCVVLHNLNGHAIIIKTS